MSSKLIMLVEDDNNLRQSFALILKRAGYSVTATDCVHEALSMIQSSHYQLVISDMNMLATRNVLLPRLSGHYPGLSIVILTDQSSAEVEKEKILNDAYYLIKPIAPERLLEFVQTFFAVGNKLTGTNSNQVSLSVGE
jgi:DNA-binding NtrC family response regulator